MGYERTHLFQQKSSDTPQPTSQFSSRPFEAPVQRKPKEQMTPDELENEAFNQHKFEAFGLQLKEKSGTITPVEQERLGVLQAKMDDFWAQRRERASRFGHDFSKIPVHPPEGYPTPRLQPMWRQRKNGVPMADDTEPMNTPQPLLRLPIQAKLRIGEPGDKYEQEADAVAARVVEQIHAPATAQSPQGQSVQRQAAEETEEVRAKSEISALQRMDEPNVEEIQGKFIQKEGEANARGEASTDLDTAINRARGCGKPLDAGLQRSMGQAMGADFSGVKVHTDAQSDQLNQSIQAKAFTTGQDVFFRQGAYEPGSRGGQELIAHELTHVVQQSGGAVYRSSKGKKIAEKEATEIQSEAKEHRASIQFNRSQDVIQRDPMRITHQGMTLVMTDEIRNHIWERHAPNVKFKDNQESYQGLFAPKLVPNKQALDAVAKCVFEQGEWDRSGTEVYFNFGVHTGYGSDANETEGSYKGVRLLLQKTEANTYQVTTMYPIGGFKPFTEEAYTGGKH